MGLFLVLMCAVAQTWTQTSVSTNRVWLNTAVTADGRNIFAVTSGSHPVYSADFGDTWQTNQNAPVALGCMAVSADGRVLATVGFSTFSIYVSTNYGTTWTQTSAPQSTQWWAMACSADGSKLIAASRTNGSSIYISTNYGSTWSSGGSPALAWSAVTCSADGKKFMAAANGDSIYTSTDFGTTWTATGSGIGNWFSLACSADGLKLIASGPATYISTNLGTIWKLANANVGAVASSADGTKLVIAGNYIYTSTNSGNSWISNSVPSNWYAVCSSADGSEIVATSYQSPSLGIWATKGTTNLPIGIQRKAMNCILSWPIPSTNFVLQQSRDLSSWTTLTNGLALDFTNLQNKTSVAMTNGSAFFRLVTQ